jgi:hypothetical protein
MREELRDLWDSIERRKWQITEAIARLPQEALSRKMPKSDWTPLQLVEHLIVAEEEQLKEIEAAKAGNIPPHKGFAFGAAVWILRRGIRVPTPGTMAPSGKEFSLEQLGKRWDQTRERLRKALEEAHDVGAFSAHHMFGSMHPEHALEITDAHLQYHQKRL